MSSKSDSETKIVEPKKPLREIRDEVLGWLDLHAWRGYDPFDGLLSPFVAPWVSGFLKNFPSSKLIRLFFIQLVKRIRFNLRKIFFIPPQENPMTFAVAALASLKAAKRREAHSLNRTKTAINKVLDLANSDTGLWGYPFPWQARAFYAEKGAPNIVASALCLRAIAEVLIPVQKEAQSNVLVEHYSKALDSLIKLFYKPDDGFFSYIEGDAVLVHNANLFGVEAVCGGIRLGLKNAIDFWPQTKAALYKSLIAQSESGRWPYGALAFHSWCDNFHTAYNILSLIKVFRTLDSVAAIDQETVQTLKSNIDDAILIGLKFYRENAFTETGSAKYYDNEVYPIETNSVAAALILFNELADNGWIKTDEAIEASAVAYKAGIRDLYLGNGEFAYRKWQNTRIDTVFIRWSQVWMLYGLECLICLNEKTK